MTFNRRVVLLENIFILALEILYIGVKLLE